MKYIIIVAIGQHREIGKDNNLPWHLPRDMQFFKETTSGHVVMMGRKNWESIPEKFRPLPNRKNIVLTRNKAYQAEGAVVIHDWSELDQHLEEDKICFITGGAEIFKQALDLGKVDEMYITHIDATFEGSDVFFPFVNWEDWNEEEILTYTKDERNAYSFTIKKYAK